MERMPTRKDRHGLTLKITYTNRTIFYFYVCIIQG
jgi:hypothetical protein